MNNEVKEIAGFKIKDEKARQEIKNISIDTVNILNYSSEEDKTEAINAIINENKKVYIPDNQTVYAENTAFTKEKFEKFMRNGKYLTKTVASNQDNCIQERDISKCPHGIYRDMIFPSENVNLIKWAHQKQSWLWNSTLWNMANFSSIVPWFQFSKNPSYEGNVPDTFNIYIGNFQVLAYDITRNLWIEVYNGKIENCAFYNYYEGASDNSADGSLPYTTVSNHRKYNINRSNMEAKVLHGWLGMTSSYVPANPNYKYIAVRMNAYTDAPYGYLCTNLGLDLKGGIEGNSIQEIAGSRTSLVTNSDKYYYLSNVEPENYDKYLTEDMFERIQEIKIDSLKNNYSNDHLTRGYIAQNIKTFNLQANSHYLVTVTNLASGNISAIQALMVSTGNDSSKTSLVSTVLAGNIVDVTVSGLVLTVAPKSGCYLNCTVTKL